mmetsp:Transcript_17188/g.46640  ORF Transcript_17188/g.46640 Transcript_17188/m.46640 type:complete len:294 (-) Transcript_17188:245-1126(-)
MPSIFALSSLTSLALSASSSPSIMLPTCSLKDATSSRRAALSVSACSSWPESLATCDWVRPRCLMSWAFSSTTAARDSSSSAAFCRLLETSASSLAWLSCSSSSCSSSLAFSASIAWSCSFSFSLSSTASVTFSVSFATSPCTEASCWASSAFSLMAALACSSKHLRSASASCARSLSSIRSSSAALIFSSSPTCTPVNVSTWSKSMPFAWVRSMTFSLRTSTSPCKSSRPSSSLAFSLSTTTILSSSECARAAALAAASSDSFFSRDSSSLNLTTWPCSSTCVISSWSLASE